MLLGEDAQGRLCGRGSKKTVVRKRGVSWGCVMSLSLGISEGCFGLSGHGSRLQPAGPADCVWSRSGEVTKEQQMVPGRNLRKQWYSVGSYEWQYIVGTQPACWRFRAIDLSTVNFMRKMAMCYLEYACRKVVAYESLVSYCNFGVDNLAIWSCYSRSTFILSLSIRRKTKICLKSYV